MRDVLDMLACSFVEHLMNDSYMPGTMFITGRQLCLACDMCPKLHFLLNDSLRTSASEIQLLEAFMDSFSSYDNTAAN